MAISGKTAAPYEIPYALGTDHPPDMAALSKTQAERHQVLLEERDAQLQRGGIAGHFYGGGSVLTRASTTYGSFSTPVKVELPKVAADQMIEISFYALVLRTVALAEATSLRLNVGGKNVITVQGGSTALEFTMPEGTANYIPLFPGLNGNLASFGLVTAGGLTESEAKTSSTTALEEGAFGLPGTGAWRVKHKSAEDKPLAIEIQGKSAGTAKIIGAYLTAHAVA